MRKRIVSIGLVVCMIFSLLTLSSVGVFAAEEALYAPATQEVAATFDFAAAADDELTAGVIESDTGKVTVNMTVDETKGTLTTAKDGDALKVAVAMIEKGVPTTNIDIMPNDVNTNASKTITTFKFKNIYTDAEGNVITNSGDTSGVCNVEIKAIGQDEDGTTVTQAGALYGIGSTWRKGARNQHGVSHYSLAMGEIPTADADGYYSLRVESYKDANGVQHTDVYGEGCATPIVKNVYCDNTSTAYADKLGYGARLAITFTGNDLNSVQTVWVKDAQIEYIAEKGSISSNNVNLFPVSVSDDGVISAYSKPSGGAASTSVAFAASRPVETGNVVIDFKLKKDAITANEATTGTDTRRYLAISGSDGNSLTLPAITYDGTGITAYDHANAPYFTYGTSDNKSVKAFASSDEWVSLRVVVSRDTVDDYWSVALFDLDASETVPVCTTYDSKGIGNFTKFSYSVYANGAARKATTADSTKPCLDIRFNMKDFSMKVTDDVVSSAAYAHRRSVNAETGGDVVGTPYWTQAADKADPMFVTWEGNIYVNSKNDPKVLLAVYSVDGKLMGVKMVGKEDGLKNGFNKDFTITADGLSTTWKISKKLFIFDGLNNGTPLVETCESMHPDYALAE